MRVAALYDIHGNLPALEAVVQQVRQAHVDHVVIGGDVLPGPLPAETIACLLKLDVPVQFIQGNGEVAVLAEKAGAEGPGWYRNLPASAREVVRWHARRLSAEHERLLASWPKTVRVKIPGAGDALFCHATPRDENEMFTHRTPEELLLPVFEGLDVPLVVCGHTHMQFDRMIGRVRVVNAGSVGMPFGAPGADWLLLGPEVQLRHTDYDLPAAATRIRSTDYPHAQDFAARHILEPPSASEMLEALTAASFR
jgi:predicted phosphodiesterase